MTDSRRRILSRLCAARCGELLLGESEGRLCLCDWRREPRHSRLLARVQHALQARIEPGESATLNAAAAQLNEYFAGKRRLFQLPLLLVGTTLQQQVWRQLLSIPCGHTLTYGELAAQLGRPTAARAVANAVGANALSLIIPCHRITARGGLGGYAGGPAAKRHLLEHEARAKARNSGRFNETVFEANGGGGGPP